MLYLQQMKNPGNFSRIARGMRKVWFICIVLLAIGPLGACASFDKAAPESTDTPSYLTPWRSLQTAPQESTFASGMSGGGGLLQLGRPVAVAAWGGVHLYIADIGHQAILRYDRMRDTFSIFYRMEISPDTRMQVTMDESLYITDPYNGQVLHVSRDGILVRTFRDYNLQRPLAVVEDNARGRILIIDGHFDQILAFNRLGRLIQIIHPLDDDGQLISGLRDLAIGPEGLYLLDQRQRRIVVTDMEGQFRYSFGADVLRQPVAIRLEGESRLIVADTFDSSLKVFVAGEKIYHQFASEAVSVIQLTDLCIDGNWLYLADATGARIEIMQIDPGALAKETI